MALGRDVELEVSSVMEILNGTTWRYYIVFLFQYSKTLLFLQTAEYPLSLNSEM